MPNLVEMPKLGFDMAEGTLVRWVKSEGDEIAKGDVLAEIETDKATVEVESSYSGIVHKHIIPEGEIVPVGTAIAVIGNKGEEINLDELLGSYQHSEDTVSSAESKEKLDKQPLFSTPSYDIGEAIASGVKASPVARRMAEEQALDLSAIKGSGPGGRIIKRDIEAYLVQPSVTVGESSPVPSKYKPSESPVLPVTTVSPINGIPEDERIPLNRLRAAIGRRMVEAKQQVPHFYVTYEYDMSKVMKVRKEINTLLDGSGEKLSLNDFILKTVALALRQFPNLNASIDQNEIIRHGHVNIGVAVAVEGGLLTVVCKDADRKSLRQISTEVKSMASRARDGKVRPDDIEGSTFSISNLGMFDVESFTAIINPPEAAILAVGSVLNIPVVQHGEIVPGQRMKATISVDHRVSDGAEAAQFLQSLAAYMEEPLRLML